MSNKKNISKWLSIPILFLIVGFIFFYVFDFDYFGYPECPDGTTIKELTNQQYKKLVGEGECAEFSYIETENKWFTNCVVEDENWKWSYRYDGFSCTIIKSCNFPHDIWCRYGLNSFEQQE